MRAHEKKRAESRDASKHWKERIGDKDVVVLHREYGNEIVSFRIKRIQGVRVTIKIHLRNCLSLHYNTVARIRVYRKKRE